MRSNPTALATATALALCSPAASQILQRLDSPILDFRLDSPSRLVSPALAGHFGGGPAIDLIAGDLLFLNPGDGRFVAPYSSHLPVGPKRAADLDGDGDDDLVIVVGTSTSIWINSAGTFRDVTANWIASQVPRHRTTVAIPADVDGDGDFDLIESSQILLSVGGFTSAVPLPRTVSADATVADFDGDGLPDLVIDGGSAALRGTGGGAFVDMTSSWLPGVTPTATSASATDFDGDGDVDLITHGATSQPVRPRLLRNDSSGRLIDVTSVLWPSAPGAVAAAVADLDADGTPDLVLALHDGSVALASNDGSGRFRLRSTTAGSASLGSIIFAKLTLADFDGDRLPDVALNRGSFNSSDQIRVADLFHNAGGQELVLVTRDRLPVVDGVTDDLTAVDVDLDGDLDFVQAATLTGALLINDGEGQFLDRTAVGLPGLARTDTVGLADLDGDGDPDLVASIRGSAVGETRFNDGEGNFTASTAGPTFPDRVIELHFADFDGDGDRDLFAACVGQDRMYLNDGQGGWTDVTATHVPAAIELTSGALVADLDADGDPDLLTHSGFLAGTSGPTRLLLNDGSGRTADASSRLPSSHGVVSDAAVLDVDGDGDLDLVVADAAGLALWENDGTASFGDASARWLGDRPARLVQVGVLDLDGDRSPDLVVSSIGRGIERLARSSPTGRFRRSTAPVDAGVRGWFTAADVDRDQDVDLAIAAGSFTEADAPVLFVNLTAQLDTPFLTTLGGRYELIVHARDVDGAPGALAFPWLSTAELATPVVLPFGALRLDLRTAVSLGTAFVGSGTGIARLAYAVPADPVLADLTLRAQALIAPAGNLSAARLSNLRSQRIWR